MGKKLRIGINGRSMGGNIRDGISNVATNLFLNFPDNPDVEWVIFSPHARLFPEIEEKGGFTHIHPEHGTRGGIWFYSRLPLDLRRFPVDVFWSPNQLLPAGIPAKTSKVLTVHDFTYLKYPETMSFLCRCNLMLRGGSSLRKADVLVAVSESTAAEVRKVVGEKLEVRVVPNGIDPKAFFPDPCHGGLLVEHGRSDYFLTVGSIEPRKNIGIIMDAYEELFQETNGNCPRWVVVYSNTWGSEKLIKRMQEGKAANGIIMKRNVTTEELRKLYSYAIALLFPSLYEGFGLPLVEAMACGCPVIASDIPICREVCHEAAVFVDTSDGKNFISHLGEISTLDKTRSRLIKEGLKTSKIYDWKKSGQALFSILVHKAK